MQPMEMETGEKTPGRVEETRRRVEKMRVEEHGQASGVFRSMAGKAREGWDRMKKMLDGKKLIWKGNTGRMVAISENLAGSMEEGVAVDIGEELEGGTVEIVREEQGEVEVGVEQCGKSETGSGGWAGFDFLDNIEIEERDQELDAKMGEERKRKRGDDGEEKEKWAERTSGVGKEELCDQGE